MIFRVSNSGRLLAAFLIVATSVSSLSAWQEPKTKPARKPKAAKQERYDASVPKPTLAGVRYGDHERHILDFWKADSPTPTPVAFVIHGGGWQGGSKERVHRFANVAALLKAGISVTAMNYRYVRQGVEAGIKPPVKAPLHDAARALQFVRSKSKEWNIDKERIAFGCPDGREMACDPDQQSDQPKLQAKPDGGGKRAVEDRDGAWRSGK